MVRARDVAPKVICARVAGETPSDPAPSAPSRAPISLDQATRQLARAGLDPELLRRLSARGLATAADVLYRPTADLVEVLDLPWEAVEALVAAVASHVAPLPETALALCARAAAARPRVRTALPPLDAALGGGLPPGSVTEVVGPAGAGKTQLCLAACAAACAGSLSAGGTALYIDSEHKFSGERLAQLAAARFPGAFGAPAAAAALLERVLVRRVGSSEELTELLENLQSAVIDFRVELIVLDSITAAARGAGGGAANGGAAAGERQRALGRQASRLKFLAESFSIPVLVVNQVAATFGGGGGGGGFASGGDGATAALGAAWAHAVNTRLVMAAARAPDRRPLRTLTVAKSPSAPETSLAYEVTAAGPVWLEGVAVPAPAAGAVVGAGIGTFVQYESGGGGGG
jgi:RAD51-like protein 1